jgi:L-iditol 2-dehydrogenase
LVGGIAEVYADDKLSHRLETAVRRGARPVPGKGVEGGIDVVFDCAGSDEALAAAIALVRPAGQIVIVGIPEGDRSSFVASTARRKEVTMSLCRRMLPSDLGRAISLVESGVVELGDLVTHRFSLSETSDAFDTLVARSGIKVVVQP